jgi:hypothetical protein
LEKNKEIRINKIALFMKKICINKINKIFKYKMEHEDDDYEPLKNDVKDIVLIRFSCLLFEELPGDIGLAPSLLLL